MLLLIALKTFKYFVAESVELANFWQIIILFSSKLNTFNSVFPFRTTDSSWAFLCSQLNKHLGPGNVVIYKCSQGTQMGSSSRTKMRSTSIQRDLQRLGTEETTQMGKIHCDPKVTMR